MMITWTDCTKTCTTHIYGVFLMRCFFQGAFLWQPRPPWRGVRKSVFRTFSLSKVFFLPPNTNTAITNVSIIKEIKIITEINTRRFPRKNVTMWRNKSARKCPKSSVLQRRWSPVIIIIIIIIITIPHQKNSNSIVTAPPRTTWAWPPTLRCQSAWQSQRRLAGTSRPKIVILSHSSNLSSALMLMLLWWFISQMMFSRRRWRYIDLTRPLIRKLAKECQYCAAYEDVLIDYKFEKNCQRIEKPKCYTAYKEVKVITIILISSLSEKM